eukprot:scaffold961_cov122-Cylindrotheca_fusiformis.AAC.24
MTSNVVSPMQCDDSSLSMDVMSSDILPSNQSDSELAIDQLLAVLVLEQSYSIPCVPCIVSVGQNSHYPYGEWRRKICQWCFKVVDHFGLDREVVSSGMNIFDRYLASRPRCLSTGSCSCPACQKNIDSRLFQLAAMTSLYISMKLYSDSTDESPYRRLRLSSFAELSRGQFTAADVSQMERSILKELRWKVNPPTPMACIPYLLRLMPSRTFAPTSYRKQYELVIHVLHELSRYLSELSVCLESVTTQYSPTQIAYASILVSMDLLTCNALPLNIRKEFNEAVAEASFAARGTVLVADNESMRGLQDKLRCSFWPEMLLDDYQTADMGHPISMAKEFGLLNLACMSRSSPISMWPSDKDLQGSPVCVTRSTFNSSSSSSTFIMQS